MALAVGFIGAATGFLLWFISSGEFWDSFVFLPLTLCLFMPSAIGFVAALFDKYYLMVLAGLVSFPVLVIVPALHVPPIFYLPFVCFAISIVLNFKKSLSKKDKIVLMYIITEHVAAIQQMIEEQMSLTGSVGQKSDVIPLTSFMILRTYQVNLPIAEYIKRVYENFVVTKGYRFANTYRLGIFYYLTRTNGVWDLKQTIGDHKLYPFMGQRKTGEYIGNHHFGYMGRAIGLSCRALRFGAGLYQLYSRKSRWKYGLSYFDQPEDSQAIADGCADFDKGVQF